MLDTFNYVKIQTAYSFNNKIRLIYYKSNTYRNKQTTALQNPPFGLIKYLPILPGYHSQPTSSPLHTSSPKKHRHRKTFFHTANNIEKFLYLCKTKDRQYSSLFFYNFFAVLSREIQ